MAIVNRVSTVMGMRRLTVAEVAKKAALSYEAVRRLYDGSGKRLDLDTLDKLCVTLQCNVCDLITHISDSGDIPIQQLAEIKANEPEPIGLNTPELEESNPNETEALLVGLFDD